MDITDAEKVTEVITDVNPDVVVHCAAWTAVDAQKTRRIFLRLER